MSDIGYYVRPRCGRFDVYSTRILWLVGHASYIVETQTWHEVKGEILYQLSHGNLSLNLKTSKLTVQMTRKFVCIFFSVGTQ